jgi:lactate dehydrogenase-like 2-hydroxyacid dehydrogenase
MNKPKVFITRKWPESVEAKLKERYQVTLNEDDRPLSAGEFKSALQQYDAVCLA